MAQVQQMCDLAGKIAAITGGAGVLCGAMSRALASACVKVAILDINIAAAEELAGEIQTTGGEAVALEMDVLDRGSIERAGQLVIDTLGEVDILINGAGGNRREATARPDVPFFDIPQEAIQWVFNLNFLGTLLCSQVFGKLMAQRGEGCILNISSITAIRPLTNIVAYAAAKAAVSNFTRWLAVYMSQNYSPHIRVNAIEPGFFLTTQNRFLLMDEETGELTPRGQAIIAHTPMGRFGQPEDLLSTVFWLLSPQSAFVHGAVVPVDGGFSAFSGV